MKEVAKIDEIMQWEGDEGSYRRKFGLMFERDITPTVNMSAGTSTLPPGHEQPKLSVHKGCEEVYFVVRGKGKFFLNDKCFEVEQRMAVYVAPGAAHRFINTGDEELELFWVNSPSVFGPVGGYMDFIPGWKKIR